MAERIEMLFRDTDGSADGSFLVDLVGLHMTRVGHGNHVLDAVYIGAIWRIRLNDACWAAIRAVAIVTV